MAPEKRAKAKIKRRSPGLVITPPAPRPVEADHPARLLFREAIESAKASPEVNSQGRAFPQETGKTAVQSLTTSQESVATDKTLAEPLKIFKEIKAETVVREDVPPPAAPPKRERSSAFEEHFGQWRPFLTEGDMCVLEALYNLTHAVGTDHCLTSMPKLAAAAGISERQTYNVVKGLERYGFIERPETFNTPTKKGTIFRLYLTRRTTSSSAGRRYHFGD